MKTCIDCGADISHLSSRTKRCQECARERKKLLAQLSDSSGAKRTATRCLSCIYIGAHGYCDYYGKTGRLRLTQHPNDWQTMNSPCREYERRVSACHGRKRSNTRPKTANPSRTA